MDAIGAQMNAFTSKDITCYYAKSTTGHAAEAFDFTGCLLTGDGGTKEKYFSANSSANLTSTLPAIDITIFSGT